MRSDAGADMNSRSFFIRTGLFFDTWVSFFTHGSLFICIYIYIVWLWRNSGADTGSRSLFICTVVLSYVRVSFHINIYRLAGCGVMPEQRWIAVALCGVVLLYDPFMAPKLWCVCVCVCLCVCMCVCVCV